MNKSKLTNKLEMENIKLSLSKIKIQIAIFFYQF